MTGVRGLLFLWPGLSLPSSSLELLEVKSWGRERGGGGGGGGGMGWREGG